ncbi:MAG: Sua5/YciO/YrdC/YwlC family protein [Bacteroidales bacterium]|nr:Sua5/YciO/YrdC/YwlC family protein [Bacteroidales bacterium]
MLVDSIEMLQNFVKNIPTFVLEKLKTFQNPMTIIYPNAKNFHEMLLGNNRSIGIRIVNHPFTTAMITQFGKPVVSTSANFSGQLTPKRFDEISPEIISQMDFVVSGYHDVENTKTSDIYKITDRGLERIR